MEYLTLPLCLEICLIQNVDSCDKIGSTWMSPSSSVAAVASSGCSRENEGASVSSAFILYSIFFSTLHPLFQMQRCGESKVRGALYSDVGSETLRARSTVDLYLGEEEWGW